MVKLTEKKIGRNKRCFRTWSAVAVGTAIVLIAQVPAHAAEQSSGVQIIKKPKSFASCMAAVGFLNTGAEVGRAYVAYATSFKAPTFKTTAGGFWAAHTTATATYKADDSTVTLTVPTWKNMKAAEKTAVESFETALLGHEEGHQKLAEDILVHFKDYPLAGGGPDKGAALRDLRVIESKWKMAIAAYLKERQDKYDQTTDHGRQQHALGGQDVILTCP
jgi:hypothetical protein